MKFLCVSLLAMLFAVSCQKKERTVVVEDQRELTMFDQQRPINIIDVPPKNWRQIPSTQFRQLNYLAGENEAVEIFLGKAGGDVVANATRWLGQFQKPAVTDLNSLTKMELLDTEAYLLEAKGDYTPGMGQPPMKDQAMFGALIADGDGVLSIKMVGPSDEVEAMRQDFLDYCKSLRLSTVNRIQNPAENTAQDE